MDLIFFSLSNQPCQVIGGAGAASFTLLGILVLTWILVIQNKRENDEDDHDQEEAHLEENRVIYSEVNSSLVILSPKEKEKKQINYFTKL